MTEISAIQAAIRAADLDGWLFYDFHHRDPIAARILGLGNGAEGSSVPAPLATRRWFYLIPRSGAPRKLVHRIESAGLDSLPGKKIVYASLEELRYNLRSLLGTAKKVAMQYSPLNAIPYVSLVDAGTVELVRAQGCKVVSSADLVQQFEARWTAGEYRSHIAAGRIIDRITQKAFARASSRVSSRSSLTEYDLQQWILDQFGNKGIVTAEAPIVAVGPHSGDPHYEPRPKGSAHIRKGDLLLLDIWGKLDRPSSVYYDITWIGYLGAQVPARYAGIFDVVRDARDRAIAFVQHAVANRRPIQGWQVDRAARDVITKAGYADHFVHRTGHNIGQEVHGNGANMDSLETHDVRRVLPRTCFSVEPGIYLPKFGIRSEVDVYVDEREARVTGPVQTAILPLLA